MKTRTENRTRTENPPRFSEHTAIVIANLAERKLRQNGGFSLQIPKLENPPSSGYLASLRGLDWILPAEACAAEDIARYVLENPPSSGRYLGGWQDSKTGFLHLDHSEHFESLPEAFRFAHENRQLAIWDCRNNRDIRLGDNRPDNRAGGLIGGGIQDWSLGDTYPLTVSCSAAGGAGEWFVWNARTGYTLQAFRFGPDCDLRTSTIACKVAHRFVEACAEALS